MAKCSKAIIFSLLISAGITLHAGVLGYLKNCCGAFKDHTRDWIVQSLITGLYFKNSHHIVEANEKDFSEVDALVVELSNTAGIKKPIVFVISKKFFYFPYKANAMACGDKDFSVIVVGSWVIDNLSKAELEGVLAHEITHIKKSHTLKIVGLSSVLVVTSMVVACLAQWFTSKNINDVVYFGDDLECHIKYKNVFIPTLYCSLFASMLLLGRYVRAKEKEADFGSVDLTGHKEIVHALEKLDGLVKKYQPFGYWLNTKFWYPWMSTHPSTKERKDYIEAYKPSVGQEKLVAA